jgi:hypothetical protein
MDGKDYLILVGAPKCGTTSIAEWIDSLPGCVLAQGKETLFFTDFADRDWSGPGPGPGFAAGAPKTPEEFAHRFSHDRESDLRVEASTDNLSCPVSPDRIAAFRDRSDVRSLRVLALTRDPVGRIVSEYEHTLRVGWQRADLLTSLKAEKERTAKGWHPLFWHTARSRYAGPIARYRHLFGDDFLVLDYHTIEMAETRERLAAFIGLPKHEAVEPMPRKNARKVDRNLALKPLFKNRLLLSLARTVVPKTARAGIRKAVTGPALARYEPSPREREFIMSALGDEITACKANGDIPTEHWSCLEGV